MKTKNDRYCRSEFGGKFTKNMICAIGSGQPYRGDSGGPLIVDDAKRTVIGVTSWGRGRPHMPHMPTVFAKITSSLKWIKSFTDGEECNH